MTYGKNFFAFALLVANLYRGSSATDPGGHLENSTKSAGQSRWWLMLISDLTSVGSDKKASIVNYQDFTYTDNKLCYMPEVCRVCKQFGCDDSSYIRSSDVGRVVTNYSNSYVVCPMYIAVLCSMWLLMTSAVIAVFMRLGGLKIWYFEDATSHRLFKQYILLAIFTSIICCFCWALVLYIPLHNNKSLATEYNIDVMSKIVGLTYKNDTTYDFYQKSCDELQYDALLLIKFNQDMYLIIILLITLPFMIMSVLIITFKMFLITNTLIPSYNLLEAIKVRALKTKMTVETKAETNELIPAQTDAI